MNIQFCEYTIYGPDSVACTDGEDSIHVYNYCKQISHDIPWEDYTEEDDVIAVVIVEDNEARASLLPGEETVSFNVSDFPSPQ